MALLPFRSRMLGGHLRVLPNATAGFGRAFGSHVSSAAIKVRTGRHTVTCTLPSCPAPPDARVALPRWHRPLSTTGATGADAGGATAPTEGGATVVSDPVAFNTSRPYGTNGLPARQLRHDRPVPPSRPSSAPCRHRWRSGVVQREMHAMLRPWGAHRALIGACDGAHGSHVHGCAGTRRFGSFGAAITTG